MTETRYLVVIWVGIWQPLGYPDVFTSVLYVKPEAAEIERAKYTRESGRPDWTAKVIPVQVPPDPV